MTRPVRLRTSSSRPRDLSSSQIAAVCRDCQTIAGWIGSPVEEIMPVGYHAWADSTIVALFVLGSPATLQLASTRTGQGRVIERNIGRSIHKIPSQDAISFVHKVSENEWWIRRLDLRTERNTALVRTLPGSEDYAWTPRGTILMGQNSILYQWTPGTGDWLEIADLGAQGVQSITRIAVSPAGDRIAIVGSRG